MSTNYYHKKFSARDIRQNNIDKKVLSTQANEVRISERRAEIHKNCIAPVKDLNTNSGKKYKLFRPYALDDNTSNKRKRDENYYAEQQQKAGIKRFASQEHTTIATHISTTQVNPVLNMPTSVTQHPYVNAYPTFQTSQFTPPADHLLQVASPYQRSQMYPINSVNPSFPWTKEIYTIILQKQIAAMQMKHLLQLKSPDYFGGFYPNYTSTNF